MDRNVIYLNWHQLDDLQSSYVSILNISELFNNKNIDVDI